MEAVITRGEPHMLAEVARERALIAEAAGKRDFAKALIGVADGVAGDDEAGLDQEIVRANAKSFLEFALELTDRHAGEPGELLNGNVIAVALLDVAHGFREPVERLE
ncbi:MAG: hypothetical protein EXS37_19945 [Opitutus sp.]|nr:hypothetical protein [Opitutus sp.]